MLDHTPLDLKQTIQGRLGRIPRSFRSEEEKRLWLRGAARQSLLVLCDYLLSPFRGFRALPHFHQRQAFLIDADLQSGTNSVNIWSRGLWKSRTISEASTILRILQNPDVSVLIRHFDEEIAARIVRGITEHFTKNPYFRYVFPEFCPPLGQEKRYSSVKSFTCPARRLARAEPTVLGEGLNSTVTGLHFDHIHDDDVETPKSVGREVSDLVREKHWARWMDWTQLAERPIEGGRIRGTYSMVGTPWHYDGIIKRMEARQEDFGFVFRWHRAWDPESNQLLCKEAYPRQTLNRDRAALDPYEFSCAILLEPVDSGSASFKVTEDLWWTPPPEGYERFRRFIAVDPAYTNSSTADYSGIAVVDVLPDDTWIILACYAPRMEPLALINELYALHERHQPDLFYVESIAASQVLWKWLKREEEIREQRIPIWEAKKPKTQAKRGAGRGSGKTLRIQKLSPRFAAGKLRLCRGGPGLLHLVEEFKQWPVGKDQHILDALATLEEYAPRGHQAEARTGAGEAPEGSIDWWEQEMEEERLERESQVGAWREHPSLIVARRAFGK